MIFESRELPVFSLYDVDYAICCDLIVLEKIQDKVGDILVAEDKIRGYVPSVDADGVVDRTIGTFTVPDVDIVCSALNWMLEEGKYLTDGEYEIPSTDDLKRQDEYGITELALVVFRQFEDCISSKKKKKTAANTQKKTDIKTARRKR